MPSFNNGRIFTAAKSTEEMSPFPTGVNITHGYYTASAAFEDPRQYSLIIPPGRAYLYDPRTDGYVRVANPGFSLTVNIAGTCLAWNPNGPSGTATGGGSNYIDTTFTSIIGLDGYKVRIVAGTGAGQERTIAYHLIGASTRFYVTQNWSTAPDNTSQYVIRSGRFYMVAGNTSVLFRYFDIATLAWTTLSGTGLPVFSNVGSLVAPGGVVFSSGAVTSATANTLTASTKNYGTDQWANQMVRIVSGPGAGQTRTISSNTATQLTVSANWTTQPTSSSTFEISGNEDHLYLGGNAAITLYRYTISTNSWATLSPVAARSAVTGGARPLILVDRETSPYWINEANYINGRRLYSFTGSNGNRLHYYDISANTWFNDVNVGGSNTFDYGNRGPLLSAGVQLAYVPGRILIADPTTVMMWAFIPVHNTMIPYKRLSPPTISSAGSDRTMTHMYTAPDGKRVYFAMFPMAYHVGNARMVRVQVHDDAYTPP